MWHSRFYGIGRRASLWENGCQFLVLHAVMLSIPGAVVFFKLLIAFRISFFMTGWKNCAVQVPRVVPYKALKKFSKALYGTTGGTCSARFFHLVIKIVGAE